MVLIHLPQVMVFTSPELTGLILHGSNSSTLQNLVIKVACNGGLRCAALTNGFW